MKELNLIEGNVICLLNDALSRFKPDYIITVERKGTALLRAVIEQQGGIDWSWERVISTSAIPGLYPNDLIGKRVLLFDDSVYRGHNLSNTKEKITTKFGDKVKIATAAFAVHENCEIDVPDFYFYIDLKDEKFKEIRKNVVTFLQKKGSLLLDTEHIEISIDLKGRKNEFYSAIAHLGKTVMFETLGTLEENENLTLFKPLKEYPKPLEDALPEGSNIDDGVWKCRFIIKSDNKIALIPIYYPVLPFMLTDEDKNKLPDCFKSLLSDEFELNYHLIGISTSIKMLSDIFAVFAGDETRPLIDINSPDIYDPKKHGNLSCDEKAEIRNQDTYSHLLAMFPKINIGAVRELVRSAIDEGFRNKSLYKKLFKKDYTLHQISPRQIPPDDLQRYAKRLTKVISDIIRDNKDRGIESNGASVYEILNCLKHDEIGKDVAIENFSAAMDQLIDEAIINTDIESTTTDSGAKRVFRTFKPDGEFITSMILRNYYDL